MREFNTKCAYCGQEFTGKTRKAKFCCASCRVMSSRQNIRKRIAEINQYKGYFEEKNAKLQTKRQYFNEQKAQFEKQQEEFNKLYQEYWPKIVFGINSESQVKFLEKDNKYLIKENDRLKNLLIKNEIDPLSTE
ncbi:MAG: hypothetical protein ABFS35_18175 [Bacteroidota bacterium]